MSSKSSGNEVNNGELSSAAKKMDSPHMQLTTGGNHWEITRHVDHTAGDNKPLSYIKKLSNDINNNGTLRAWACAPCLSAIRSYSQEFTVGRGQDNYNELFSCIVNPGWSWGGRCGRCIGLNQGHKCVDPPEELANEVQSLIKALLEYNRILEANKEKKGSDLTQSEQDAIAISVDASKVFDNKLKVMQCTGTRAPVLDHKENTSPAIQSTETLRREDLTTKTDVNQTKLQFRDSASQGSELNEDKQGLSSQVSEVKEDNLDLGSKISESTYDQQFAQIPKSSQDNGELSAQTPELQQNNKNLTSQVPKLKQENCNLASQISKVTQDNQQLASQISALKHENRDLSTNSEIAQNASVQDVTSKLSYLRQFQLDMANQVSEHGQNIPDLHSKISKLQKGNCELVFQLSDLKKDIDGISYKAFNLNQDSEQLAPQVSHLQGNNQQLASQLSKAEQANRNLATQISEIKQSNSDLSSEVSALKQEMNNARDRERWMADTLQALIDHANTPNPVILPSRPLSALAPIFRVRDLSGVSDSEVV